jgi:hypothetical protein
LQVDRGKRRVGDRKQKAGDRRQNLNSAIRIPNPELAKDVLFGVGEKMEAAGL